MPMFPKALYGIVLAVGVYLIYPDALRIFSSEVVVGPLPEDVYWGAPKPESVKEDEIRPFKITTSPSVLEHLKKRLKETKFPHAPLKGVNFEYGFNLDHLKEIRSYWLNKYDWNARLKFLNSFPHFKTIVSGLDIHFMHVKPAATSQKSLKVIRILLLHSWPGSIREFYELIPHLVTPRKDFDFIFEVVAPSLPGFGYSEAAVIPGLSTAQMGVIFKKLMKKLGYEKFYVHGGNWGFKIGRDMSISYPENVLGLHATMCTDFDLTPRNLVWTWARIFLDSIYPPLIEDPKEDHDRLYPLRDFFTWLWTETGYAHIHATKPDTIGAALLDSPTGLAAYILGKFATLTNPANINLPDGGLTKKFSLDALLDNVMIYWTTDSNLISIRLYSEYCSTKYKDLNFEIAPVKAPTACARFRHELFYSPAFSLREKFKNLVKISKINDGGLYPTFELPDVVANDIWSSIPLFARANKNVTDSLKK